MTKNTSNKIFLSYSWANKDVADEIDKIFSSIGIVFTRDVRGVSFKGNLKQFMKKVRSTDYVLTLVSDEFLRSQNCMFEIMELMTDDNYRDKTLQVVLDTAKVFDENYRIEILEYWKTKTQSFSKKLNELGVEYIGSEIATLKHLINISNNIGEFLQFLVDENSYKHVDLLNSNYAPVLKFIGHNEGIELSELIKIVSIEVEEDRDLALTKYSLDHPTEPMVYFAKGVYSKTNNEALIFYDKGIELSSADPKLYFNRGNIKFALGDIIGGNTDYDSAIELNPSYAKAFCNRGRCKSELGNNLSAIEDYNKSIKLDSTDVIALLNRGISKARLGDQQASIEDFDRAIELDPTFASAYYSRGVSKSSLGDNKGALEEYDKTIELDPYFSRAYYNRGNHKVELGNEQGALTDYDKAIELDPTHLWANYNRGKVKLETGDEQGALNDFNISIELDPTNVRAYCARGIAKSLLKDEQGAMKDYDKALEIDPTFAFAYFNRGILKSTSGDEQGAMDDKDQAIELDPSLS